MCFVSCAVWCWCRLDVVEGIHRGEGAYPDPALPAVPELRHIGVTVIVR